MIFLFITFTLVKMFVLCFCSMTNVIGMIIDNLNQQNFPLNLSHCIAVFKSINNMYLIFINSMFYISKQVIELAFDTIEATRENIVCLSSFFFAKLRNSKTPHEGYLKVKSTIVRRNVLEKDLILIPINVNNQHWVLAVRKIVCL